MEMLSFDCVHDALQAMTEQLAAAVRQKTDGPFHIALSGGSGRRNMYGKSRGHGCASIGSTNDASRRTTRKAISNMPTNCCFKRSASPTTTCSGYGAKRIPNKKPGATRRPSELPLQDGLPRFDAVVLGIGDDGHTASIFPHTPGLLTDPACYAVSRHPVTGQWRITMTGPLILNGAELLFPVIGPGKAEILQKIDGPQGAEYPAGYILRRAERAAVYTNCKI
mgnify:CR=1 FL=1